MVKVSVRELKQRASKLLRLVHEKGEIVEITYHGEAIARLVPVQSSSDAEQDNAAWWSKLDELTAEINARWPKGVSATDAVEEGRKE